MFLNSSPLIFSRDNPKLRAKQWQFKMSLTIFIDRQQNKNLQIHPRKNARFDGKIANFARYGC